MIVRRLRPDEYHKGEVVQCTAFNFSYDAKEHTDDTEESEVWGAYLDDGETLTSMIYPNIYQVRYGHTYLPMVGIGGVATLPQYRRLGGVRAIFDKFFEIAPERGWALSFLYPFSYDYYRKFGYERVLRSKTVSFGVHMLAHIPRNGDAVLYTGFAQLPDLLDIYERYSAQIHLACARPMPEEIDEDDDEAGYAKRYSPDPHKTKKYTYIWYDGAGKPQAYATLKIEEERMHVRELCYTSLEALKGILGFLRMYEGQVSRFCFEKLPESTPLEWLVTNFWEVDVELHSSAMGRVLLTKSVLEAYDYPHQTGSFVLAADDSLGGTRGTYRVLYSGGRGQVETLSDMPLKEADITLNSPALARMLLGSETLTLEEARYLPGCRIQDTEGARAFLHAFTKRPGHLHANF